MEFAAPVESQEVNGEPDELPGPLLDRFAVRCEVTVPHPDALAKIEDDDLRDGCRKHYLREKPDRTFREFLSVDRLIRNGVDRKIAFASVFGPAHEEVYTAFISAVASREEKARERKG
jgi:hypothetical protein